MRHWSRALRALRVLGPAVVGLLLGIPNATAETPGGILRQYLDARLRGDIDAARALWSAREEHRSRALGTTYTNIEARFDDYWLLSADERQELVARSRFVVEDSVVASDVAHFTVAVVDKKSGKKETQLRYVGTLEDGTWRLALPMEHDSRTWTRREGRYVRLFSKRLVRINREATQWLDDGIVAALHALGASERASLRLERVKLDFLVCETDKDLRDLLGATDRAGYLPGTARIVSRRFPDLPAAIGAVVNVSLGEAPHALPPWLADGLAAALGGSEELDARVLLQRLCVAVQADPELLKQLDAGLESQEGRIPIAALWCAALLDRLGSKAFLSACRQVAGTHWQATATDAGTVLDAFAGQGQSRKTLASLVRDFAAHFEPTLRAGTQRWPEDVRGLTAVIQWRDLETAWSLNVYETGNEYTFTVSPMGMGVPRWVVETADSLSKAKGLTHPELKVASDVPRPPGNPPEIVLLFAPRFETSPEPFVSNLFEKQFSQKEYINEFLGLFVSIDWVRLYDYRRGVLVAEYVAARPTSSDAPYWQEGPGHLAFRLPSHLFPGSPQQYDVQGRRYTGE